jgi:short-subunit dehydrogenase
MILRNKVIWLTGASSGIGYALCESLLQMGNRVFASARNCSTLETLNNQYPHLYLIPCDMTDSASLQQAAEKIKTYTPYVDILIANAGTCEYLDVTDFDSALIQRVMNTNFMGTVKTIETALPFLYQAFSPYIAVVSSSAAWLPLPRAAAYGASKAALNYFMESLRSDLTHLGFKISMINPGFVQTNLTDKNDFAMPMRISAQQAATAILRGLEKEQWNIHFPKKFTYILKIIACLPARLRMAITARMSRLHGDKHP